VSGVRPLRWPASERVPARYAGFLLNPERVPPANPAAVSAAPLRRTGKGPVLSGFRPAMPVFTEP